MVNGIHLSLLIGPVVPAAVSREVLDALRTVTVTVASGHPSGFQLTFSLSTRSPLHTLFLLSGGVPFPLMRVVLLATMSGRPEVLVDGVMTNHQVSPGPDAGHATLTVTGEDLSRVMDYIDFSGFPYPAMPAEARVAVICAKYAMFGFVPAVIPSVLMDIPIPTERIPRHKGTDLCYVKGLAEEVGYVFYVQPGPAPGMNVAYWGPEVRVGVPQPALNINFDAHTNVESLSFTVDGDKKVLPLVMIHNELTKIPIPIPIPDITPLNPPLGLVPVFGKTTKFETETAKYNPIRAAVIGLTKAARSSDAVFGKGTLDVLRYGRILKARQLVGVRGAGPAFDGLHYVSKVTHRIQRGEYKQDFELVRNGLISTLSQVPP